MVEDYTNAFLVSALVLCLMALMTIWAVWGFAAALFAGWSADRLIMLEAHRAAESSRSHTAPQGQGN